MKDRLGGWLENGGGRGSKKGAVFDSVAADRKRGEGEIHFHSISGSSVRLFRDRLYRGYVVFFFFRNRDFTRGRDGDLRR